VHSFVSPKRDAARAFLSAGFESSAVRSRAPGSPPKTSTSATRHRQTILILCASRPFIHWLRKKRDMRQMRAYGERRAKLRPPQPQVTRVTAEPPKKPEENA